MRIIAEKIGCVLIKCAPAGSAVTFPHRTPKAGRVKHLGRRFTSASRYYGQAWPYRKRRDPRKIRQQLIDETDPKTN